MGSTDGRIFNLTLHHADDEVRPDYNVSLPSRCQMIIDEILELSLFLADQSITDGNTIEHRLDDQQPAPLIIHIDRTQSGRDQCMRCPSDPSVDNHFPQYCMDG